MNDLIEALTIFKKYLPDDNYSPTHCEHDVLFVSVSPTSVRVSDISRLEELSFRPDHKIDGFSSYRFGSC